ncbi:DUF1553 domain-containing protein [Aporhodopirellula aestuarii]|uniref:DUF1553 domain-containing protein n=1 Tax=Aporhodopirellula aestuarii TaxID=2950107 RepID=A0ABT0U7C2_9BACT|nr:DUF1553 domain-containing protein [Aporhodopirellula aestuarii]MCM2372251.1 DUF1553 domain-containing protein [Aporhodopirellula aestuarii]
MPCIADEAVDFNRDIRPLLSGNCLICHGPDEEERAAGLRLDTEEGSREDLGGYAAIVPGAPEDSELLERLTTDDEDLRMPPEGKGRAFAPEEVELVRRWIEQGGSYAKHWSYVRPQPPELPEVKNNEWPINDIDRFILARLEAEGLTPSPCADRLTLARRVSLDLTGLPPTWEDANAFANDPRPDAYERFVDQLLASPSFGERWARVWLDLARYADSSGYADDPPRTIWAYRDYVIRSLNENKPFDQFTIEQIAGDLLENPTPDQLIATAFHRNTMTNNEGGTNDEEFRNVAVVDRVNTTMAVWMGTTIACAQCHTHKYDPITHDEYFQFFAFFNNTEDADRKDERPVLDVWADERLRTKQELQERIAELESNLDRPTPELRNAQNEWLASVKAQPDWKVLRPVSATLPEHSLSVDEAGWVTTEDDTPANSRCLVQIPVTERMTGFKLRVPEQYKNLFKPTQISAFWKPDHLSTIDARYLRIELPGKKKILHLAEVQAFVGGDNVASRGTATQSSTRSGGNVQYAIDGNTDGDFKAGSVTHTEIENAPWLEVDFGSTQPIESVAIWNRTDGGKAIAGRLAGLQISLLDENRKTVWTHTPEQTPAPKGEYATDGKVNLQLTPVEALSGDGTTVSEQSFAIAPPNDRSSGTVTIELASIPVGTTKFQLLATSDEHFSQWAVIPRDVRNRILATKNETSTDDAKISKYFRSITPLLKNERAQIQKLESKLAAMKPDTTVPIMRQLPESKRRTTHVHLRGSYLSPGNEVSEGVPASLHPLPDDTHGSRPDRMDLARWLIDENNPLTPRVIANRHWEQIFGIGLVETSEEFGSQGELPSHPELLDYLAVQLRDGGWDLKALLRLMVTSATYRQSSVATHELLQRDPANRLCARGPRFRASAELVRDQALFASGLLSPKMYGPPVKPVQPDLGLKAAFGSATDWQTSNGEDRYRRGLYTMWRRSSPYPSMAQFDAPNREVCTVRRIRTNTPLQALVTLNDPVYIEAAQGLARRTVPSSEADSERIQFAFHQTLLREPSESETARLEELLDELIAFYSDRPNEAIKMATEPLGPLPQSVSDSESAAIEYAAWTVLSNVILNLDEMLMKR